MYSIFNIFSVIFYFFISPFSFQVYFIYEFNTTPIFNYYNYYKILRIFLILF